MPPTRTQQDRQILGLFGWEVADEANASQSMNPAAIPSTQELVRVLQEIQEDLECAREDFQSGQGDLARRITALKSSFISVTVAAMPEIMHDAPFGQLARLVSGNRVCRYPEEKPDFDIDSVLAGLASPSTFEDDAALVETKTITVTWYSANDPANPQM